MVLRGLAGVLGLWTVGAITVRAVLVPAQECPPVTSQQALDSARQAAAWIERAQRPDGTYLYEYNRDTREESPDYNVVRHAGVTMSLYQLAEVDKSVLPAADRATAWMRDNLARRDGWAALQDPRDGEIELGASALMLAALAQRRIATGDPQFDGLMHEVGNFILVMQQADGSFLLRWLPSTGAPQPELRSKYATGEAFWALALLHRLFPGEGWDAPSRKVADYLSLHRDAVEKQKFPPWADQWAAYGLAEMAAWPGGPHLNEANIAYAHSLAERFGFLVRVESQRRDNWFSDLIHGRRARSAGMGTWGEGLDSLWRLSQVDPRLGDIGAKVGERAVCTAGMLTRRQVESEDPVLSGGWFTEGVTRMDDQQHALSALFWSRNIIGSRAKGTN